MKYDLHMHSQFSKDFDTNRVETMSAKQFVDTLIGKVDVFSITDHNCFNAEYYNSILKYISDKKIKIIPGCEFNVYLELNKNDKYQANIYFSPKTDPETLEKTIAKIYENKNKPTLGFIIDSLNEKMFDFIICPEADKSGGINKVWSKIVKLGEKHSFFKNGMQRVFKSYDSKDGFNKTLANSWALSYFKASTEFNKLVEKYDDETLNYITFCVSRIIRGEKYEAKGYDEAIKKLTSIVSNYGSCFTYFSFSDWHNKEIYAPTHNNYIYGNDELPFETLELAVLDPLSRIEVVPIAHSMFFNETGIKHLSFVMNDKPYEVDFSIGLNSIIGERASGKSLLMAVLLKLYEKTNKKLDGYKKDYSVNVDSIKCETFDGEILSAGQLNSMQYIEQDTISKIFDKPSESENALKSYFAKLEEVDTRCFDSLISELKNLKQYDDNYKSVTSYLKTINTFDSYGFTNVKFINTSSADSYFNNGFNNLSLFVKQLKSLGINSTRFELISASLKNEKMLLDNRIRLFNQLIDLTNREIDKMNLENSAAKENARLSKTAFDQTKKMLFDNLNNLLVFTKIKYLINNFYIGLPDIKVVPKSKYLFVSCCEANDDLKDILLDDICSNIVKAKLNKNGFDLINAYIRNETALKATSKSLYDNLEKKFISNNLKYHDRLFEVKEYFDASSIKDLQDIERETKANNLEDISNSSLGRKSIAYLELLLDSDASILLFDQPEDNVDNHYLSHYFVPLIKGKKKTKQLIFITHNPSVAVYADSFNYIYASNKESIEYENYYIESQKDKENILDILDGGTHSFSDRNLKYGNVKGEYRYDANND